MIWNAEPHPLMSSEWIFAQRRLDDWRSTPHTLQCDRSAGLVSGFTVGGLARISSDYGHPPSAPVVSEDSRNLIPLKWHWSQRLRVTLLSESGVPIRDWRISNRLPVVGRVRAGQMPPHVRPEFNLCLRVQCKRGVTIPKEQLHPGRRHFDEPPEAV
jgi:hypothetical protein